MFDGDPQARVKDRDRDRATYVIDAALRNGQITQQDRDLRVERVRAAATVADLASLTRDLTTPAPVPSTALVPPTPADPHTPGSIAVVPGVPPDLYGPQARAGRPVVRATTVTINGGSPTRRRGIAGCLLPLLIFFGGPLISGIALFAGQSDGGSSFTDSAPEPAGPPFELSAAGIRTFLTAYEESFETTKVVRAVLYDGYVVTWARDGNGDVTLWSYRDGAFDQLGDPMLGVDETDDVDLAALRPGRVMSLVRTAEETLAVPGTTTSFVIYDRNTIDDQPQVAVYVNNQSGNGGYVVGDLDGNVTSVSKP